MCKTDWATESTCRENLTTFKHPECHCPYGYKLSASPVSLPGMFVLEGHLCLPQTVTLAWSFKQCWRPHSWLPFSWIESNLTLQICVAIDKNASAKTYMGCSSRSKHCSKPGQLFPQIYFMCGVLFTGIEQIPT